MRTKLIAIFLAAVVILLITIAFLKTRKIEDVQIISAPDLSHHPIYSKYDFGEIDNVIDFGIQPLAVRVGVISEAMRRDVILRRFLSDQGLEIRFHSFMKGADINFFLQRGDIEMAMAGDMPTITAAATLEVTVAALCNQAFDSIVARRHMMVEELRGKPIGYAFGSSAHYILLRALSSAGLGEEDVRLIPLDITEMPDALGNGEIDAFSAWDPIVPIALARPDGFVTIHRGLSSAYLYFSRAFAEKHPEPVHQIVASQLRAIAWMQQRDENLLEACRWTLGVGQALSGKEPALLAEQYVMMIKKDVIFGNTSASIIPENHLKQDGLLHREFEFLKALGKIPPSSDWDSVRNSFDRQIISEVLANPGEYSLDEYDYDNIAAPFTGPVDGGDHE